MIASCQVRSLSTHYKNTLHTVIIATASTGSRRRRIDGPNEGAVSRPRRQPLRAENQITTGEYVTIKDADVRGAPVFGKRLRRAPCGRGCFQKKSI